MRVLGEVWKGRDNNLNLIRVVAATMVLVSHAWPIALGPGTREPLEELIGYSLGTLAVFVFFAISGFLISASFEQRRSLNSFVFARARRIMPGLIASLLIVGFVMGPFVTDLPLSSYLVQPETWLALLRNATLLWPYYTLPGVFETNPYPTVQGSIWTLIHEVLCYLGVVVIGLLGILQRSRAAFILLLLYGVGWMMVERDILHLEPRIDNLRVLSFPFVVGIAFYIWRDHLILSFSLVVLLAVLFFLLRSSPVSSLALILALSYTIFYFAYRPTGPIRAYNQIGDYSYGTYLYAFPVQGLMVWLSGSQGPAVNIALALPATLACAVLSWHFIEKPALSLGSNKRHQ